MAETVVGVFETHEQAVHAIEELRKAGFRASQISLLTPDPREVEGFAEELGATLVRAGTAGVAAGGLLGGLGGWLLSLTTLAIPGIGPILAAGPVAAALVGALTGVTLGGFAGLLVALGLPRSAAEEYDREVRAGRTLVIVHTDGEYGPAEAALGRARPLGIHHYAERIAAEPPAAEGRTAAPAPGAEPGVVTLDDVVAMPIAGEESSP